MISQKCQRLFHCMLVRGNPGKIYKGYVVDICFKNQKNNKRMSQADIANLSLQIFLYEMCLEIVSFLHYIGMEKRRSIKYHRFKVQSK